MGHMRITLSLNLFWYGAGIIRGWASNDSFSKNFIFDGQSRRNVINEFSSFIKIKPAAQIGPRLRLSKNK